MHDSHAGVNPYITGAPIRAPEDFFGRERELEILLNRIQRGQSVAVIAPPRVGGTSLLNRLLQPDIPPRLGKPETQVVLLDCADRIHQPLDFYRRLARQLTLRRPALAIDPSATDEKMLAYNLFDTLEETGRQWVLLLDNFEALRGFPGDFFDQLRARASGGHLVIILTSRVPLNELDLPKGRSGSPFWHFVQTVYLDPWTEEEVMAFLRETSATCGVDIMPWADLIYQWVGGIPPHVQQAASEFFEAARRGEVDTEAVRSELINILRPSFAARWDTPALRQPERELLTTLAYGKSVVPSNGTGEAMERLQRLGYLKPDGAIAAQLLGDYLRRTIPRLTMYPSNRTVMIGGQTLSMPRRDYELLLFLYQNEGLVCGLEDIVRNVWGYDEASQGVNPEAMVHQRVRAVRLKIEEDPKTPRHIINVQGTGYKFENYTQAE